MAESEDLSYLPRESIVKIDRLYRGVGMSEDLRKKRRTEEIEDETERSKVSVLGLSVEKPCA